MMKPFLRTYDRNGSQYVYEVTPYIDPATGKVRQRSKYLGKKVDGKVEKVRMALPKRSFDYGDVLLAYHAMRDLHIDEDLYRLLPTEKARCVLALAFGRILERCALGNTRLWYQGTVLAKIWGDLPLSTSAVSELLPRLGDSSVMDDLCDALLRRWGSGSPLLYDLTAFSSSSRSLELAEYGDQYRRTGLPQVNLSIIAHKDLGIPLSMRAYPGSIPDVALLKGEVERLKALGLQAPTLIMDRGFHSTTNLEQLVKGGFDFIMPASASFKEVRSLISQASKGLAVHENYRQDEGEGIFVKEVHLSTGPVDGFLYYDPASEAEERYGFHLRLEEALRRLQAREVRKWERPVLIFAETARDMGQFIRYKVVDGRFQTAVRDKAVAQHLNRAGKFMLMDGGRHGWKECLTWYRERDGIEKMFMSLKNDLAASPLRVQGREALLGAALVNFLALMIRCRLLAMMRSTELCRKRSLPALLLLMGNIGIVEMADGTMHIDQITAQQRAVLKTLKIDINMLCA